MVSVASRNTEMIGTALALAATSSLFFYTDGNVPVAVLPVFLLVIARALPHLASVRPDTLAAVLFGLFLFFDNPSGRPFLDYDPMTEQFGALLFDPLHNLFHISALVMSLFEVVTFLLLFWVAFLHGSRVLKARLHERSFQVGLMLAALIPLTGALFSVYGLTRGGQINLIIPQIRPFPLIASWILIGLLVSSDRLPRRFLMIMVGVQVLKAIQGLYAYYFVFDGTLGKREYLLGHASSDYFATALLTLGTFAFVTKHQLLRLGAIFLSIVMILPWILNERRASSIGVGFTLILAPFILRHQIRRKHVALGMAAALVAVLYTAGTWGMSAPLGAPSQLLISLLPVHEPKKAPDYRALENYSLLSVVQTSPLTGLGFGSRIPMIEELPDMSDDYAFYDLIPHNSVLYMWAVAGPFGMAALGTLIAAALAVMMQIFQRHHSLTLRLFAFVSFSGVIRWLVFVYADMGLMEPRLAAYHAFALGIAMRFLDKAPIPGEVV